ncbi:MAG: hypothetical protein H0W20_07315 [Chthoniobacterales bacterium]|nr:hypothetical protein [Chthoniobacterales bacterium]
MRAETESSDSERLQKLERAVELLQQRNADLEKEVSALKKSASPAPRPPREMVSAPPASDGKSIVTKTEVKEEKQPVYAVAAASEFKLTLGGFIQAQFEAGDVSAFEGRFQPASGEIKDRFRIRRARINVSGDYKEEFDFKLEGEFTQSDVGFTVRDASGRTLGSNSNRTAFGATDLFANWHRFPELNVKVGQYKAPFGLEQLTSDTKLFTPERSLVTTALTPERQIGVMLWGKPLTNLWPEQKDLLSYSVGVFNGTGRNISTNDNNEFMYVGRLEVMAVKSKILNQEVGVKFGANALSSRDEAGTTISGAERENSDGSLTGFTLPSAAERSAYGADASVRVGPFDFVGEYISQRVGTRTVNGIAPLFTGFRADGYYLQGSYFVIPKKLQLVTKWESFNPGQLVDDDIHSITAGVNYYLKGDDLKLLANYIHTWSDFRAGNAAFEHSEFDQVLVRLQVMF